MRFLAPLRDRREIEDVADFHQKIIDNDDDGKSFLDAAEARLETEKLREATDAMILQDDIYKVFLLPNKCKIYNF